MRSLFDDQVDVWSDFVGGGSSATDYNNGDNPVASANNLKVADYFSIDASFSEACAIMKGAKDHLLTGEACTTEAKFVCVKSCKFSFF